MTSEPGQDAPAEETGVTLTVTGCEVSEFGTAEAKVTLTSSKDWSLVALKGDLTDESGTIIGQGFGTVSDVVAGRTYNTNVIYSVDGTPSGQTTCTAQVDYAV